jgi:tetratricopeptide (TPR) repeat protein
MLSVRRKVLAFTIFISVGAVAVWWFRHDDDFMDHVRAMLEKRDFRQASVVLSKRLEDAPDDQEARLLAAKTARREGASSRAGEHLKAYEQRNGSRDEIALEETLWRVQWGDVAEAERLFLSDGTSNGNPNMDLVVEAYLAGIMNILDQMPPGAVILPKMKRYCTRALWAADIWLKLRSSPADRAQGHLWRGRIYDALLNHPESVAEARMAVESDPENVDARRFLALIIAEESPEESIEHLRFVLARAPDDANIQAKFASGLRGIGHREEARALLDRLLKLHPNDVDYLIERGNLAIDELQTDAAKRFLSRAEALSPNHLKMLNSFRRLMFLVGDKESGRKYLERFEAQAKREIEEKERRNHERAER